MRVLVVANDHVGTKMAGPGIRALRFATELAGEHDVTLVVPFETDIADERITIVQDDPWDARRMRRRVFGTDVVISQKLPVTVMRGLARSSTVAIYDLYAPLAVESLAWASQRPPSRRDDAAYNLNAITQVVALSCGDAFICASEQQRDFWLGSLVAAGRIDLDLYRADESLRSVIDVVPFGIDPDPPRHERPVVKDVVRGIASLDKLLLWGGGIWNWFDPLTVIRAVAALSRDRDDIRLLFLGLRHPNTAVPRMEMEQRALTLADELNLTDRVVFFNDGWVPYGERGAYYLEADVGVSAHFDHFESRLAFRTRLLDCFWAGLPVVTTQGDALGEIVATEALGRTVRGEDVHGWARALSALLDDDAEQMATRERLAVARDRFLWPNVVAPLRRMVESTPPRRGSVPALTLGRYAFWRAENAVLQRGTIGAADAALRLVTGSTAPLEQRLKAPLP
jgi:glycosyltransferase involved in cell wall biosynthesis